MVFSVLRFLLERPSQLAFQEMCGDFAFVSRFIHCSTSLSLFSHKIDPSTLATESLSPIGFQMLENRLTLEPRIGFQMLADESEFNNVGAVLATACWLLLTANR